jgi:hypothetical protein
MKRLAIYCVVLEIALGMTIGVAQVTTSQYDNMRTQKTQEWAAAVNPAIRKAAGDYLARNVGWRMDA